MHGLRESRTDVLVRIEMHDGELVRGVLRPEADAFVIPSRSSGKATRRPDLSASAARWLAE